MFKKQTWFIKNEGRKRRYKGKRNNVLLPTSLDWALTIEEKKLLFLVNREDFIEKGLKAQVAQPVNRPTAKATYSPKPDKQ